MNHPFLEQKQVSVAQGFSALAGLVIALLLWEKSREKKDLIEEHESLIKILRRAKKKGIKREAKKQERELTEYRKNPKHRGSKGYLVEEFRGYTTKKLEELAQSGGFNADTGLEVEPDQLRDELMRRYERQGEKALRKAVGRQPKARFYEPPRKRKNRAVKAALKKIKSLSPGAEKPWKNDSQYDYVPNENLLADMKSYSEFLAIIEPPRERRKRKNSPKACKGGKSFRPPVRAAKEAREGLRLRREYHRGGTKVGIARARDIANRKCLPVKTVKRMKSYFARHKHDKLKQKKPPSNGRIAWKLWGGNAGKSWTSKVLKKYE